MQDLRIKLVQTKQFWEDKEANYGHLSRLLAESPEADLILIPEMFNTGFSMKTSLAESMGGTAIQWLKALSSSQNAAIYTSLMIQENGAVYNRGVFVTENDTFIYDKRKTFGLAQEDKYFNAGVAETIVSFKGWNIQLQICYDLRFPEIARNELAPNGQPKYDLLLYVANWPDKRSLHWNVLLKARAIENQCYVAAVNRVGTDVNGHSYSGDSQVINALGELEKAPSEQESVQVFRLSKRSLQNIREKLPFIKDR